MGSENRGETREADWWHEREFVSGIRQQLRMLLVHAEKTPYQNLEVFEHGHLGRVLILDDILQTTQRDEYIYNEMMAHVPLLGRDAVAGSAASVLIIGGGDGGVLREVLHHPWVERVVMVEIDEAVVRACEKYLGFNGDLDDPRLKLIFGDGAAYVEAAATRKESFDVIIVDATDPEGPGELLFNETFFEHVRDCLTPTGVTTRHLAVPFYSTRVLEAGYRYHLDVFGNAQVYRAAVPTYLGGDMAFVISSKSGHPCDSPFLSIRRRYYNADIHTASFAIPADWKRVLVDE
jgi:spermidine synthase